MSKIKKNELIVIENAVTDTLTDMATGIEEIVVQEVLIVDVTSLAVLIGDGVIAQEALTEDVNAEEPHRPSARNSPKNVNLDVPVLTGKFSKLYRFYRLL